MKKALILLLACVANYTFSQEELVKFKNDLKTSTSEIIDVIPIENKVSNELNFFLTDAKNVYGFKLNEKFGIEKKVISEEKRRKYKTIVGYSIKENNSILLFLSNKSKKKFGVVNLSFNDDADDNKEFKLKSQHERFLQTVNYNNKFYLISAEKRSETNAIEGLYIYTFDNDGNAKRNKINLTNLKGSKKRSVSFPKAIIPFGNESITKIENNLPTSIEMASSIQKVYRKDDKLLITIDKSDDFTQVLNIDLNTLEAVNDSFDKPLKKKKTTNSFLNNEIFYTIAASKDSLGLRVYNYNTKELIKEYKVGQEDNITFKNTPIIQKGGFYKKYRELESTKKFLRKITAERIGVSSYYKNNNFVVTLGGYDEVHKGGFPMFGGIPIASIGNITMFFNPAVFAYHSGNASKSTIIEGLFDNNFNHVKGEIDDNVFEKITDYKGEKTRDAETIFRFKDYFIFGFYNKFNKNYVFYKFEE